MVVRQPSKLVTWVRFPSPAPTHNIRDCRRDGGHCQQRAWTGLQTNDRRSNVLLTLEVDHHEGLVILNDILDAGGPVPADVEGSVVGIETEL